MFLPTTMEEMKVLGWSALDVILVTGDTYIDSPFTGVAVIGKVLVSAGYRVGIIAQPDTSSARDIRRLGEPALFWGVTGGSVDSMVANYTALKKRRQQDDFTPGGINVRRPDRAVIVYCNLIRRYCKNTAPVVIGGIEASLRRVAHYDFWSDRVRRSVLFDAKADFLIYGMGEKTALQLAGHLKGGRNPRRIPGLCYAASAAPKGYTELPAFDAVRSDHEAFLRMHQMFHRNTDPLTAAGLCQRQGHRYLVQNPPPQYPSPVELDAVYEHDYERAVHPHYARDGEVRALETIRFSLTTHRGCYGACRFCAIAVHQGRTVHGRSPASIIREAKLISSYPDFKGYLLDVGGPTANMYGFECRKKKHEGPCIEKDCLFPEVCPSLQVNHSQQIALLRELRAIPRIKKAVIASGIRHDLILADETWGETYLQEIVRNHVSGQLKVAPEHSERHVLELMGKPGTETLLAFKSRFDRLNRALSRSQFLTYYLMAAHPGCTQHDMVRLAQFVKQSLRMNPEQIQIFTPTPATDSTAMYHTGCDPHTGNAVFVEKDPRHKQRQKSTLLGKRDDRA